MKKFAITIWLTLLCFFLLGNVHAWDVPTYLRVNSGTRMWFTLLGGDAVQKDRTKIDLIDNLGIKRDKLVWEYFASVRVENIHVIRLRAEPFTDSYQSGSGSYQKIGTGSLGYDLDFYMTPQLLFGCNFDAGIMGLETRVKDATVANSFYNYLQKGTHFVPGAGLHGTFYPILDGISLRPNISGRFKWWNFNDLEAWDWEVAAAVDVPVNPLWTWGVTGGYRVWHIKLDRSQDTLDLNRTGFFIETSVLF